MVNVKTYSVFIALILLIIFTGCDNKNSNQDESKQISTTEDKNKTLPIGRNSQNEPKQNIGTYQTDSKNELLLSAALIGLIDIDLDRNGKTIDIDKVLQTLPWKQISVSRSHAVGIKKDGTLWIWKFAKDAKRLRVVESNSTTQIGNQDNWVFVSAGYRYTMAINSAGELYGWGINSHGQIGIDDKRIHKKPVKASTKTDWSFVSAGFRHTMAINSSGELYGWGYNGFGQIGDGNKSKLATPKLISADKRWRSVSSGTYHTLATDSNGKLYAWGYNRYGQVGDRTGKVTYKPTPINSNKIWKLISAGGYHSTAISDNEELFVWGSNSDGQLGTVKRKKSTVPIQIKGDGWKGVLAVGKQTVAIDSDDKIYLWGRYTPQKVIARKGAKKRKPVQKPQNRKVVKPVTKDISKKDIAKVAVKKEQTKTVQPAKTVDTNISKVIVSQKPRVVKHEIDAILSSGIMGDVGYSIYLDMDAYLANAPYLPDSSFEIMDSPPVLWSIYGDYR